MSKNLQEKFKQMFFRLLVQAKLLDQKISQPGVTMKLSLTKIIITLTTIQAISTEPAVAQNTKQIEETRAINARTLSAVKELSTSLGNGKSSLAAALLDSSINVSPTSEEVTRINLISDLKRRQQNLMVILESNPAEVQSLLLPKDAVISITNFLPEAKAYLERPVYINGQFVRMVEDSPSFTKHRELTFIKTSNQMTSIYSSSDLSKFETGHNISVTGTGIGEVVLAIDVNHDIISAALDSLNSKTSSLSISQHSSTDTDADTKECAVEGPQKILAVLVSFPDYPMSTKMTHEKVKGNFLGNAYAGRNTDRLDRNLNDYWQQVSDGKIWIDPGLTVVGPLKMASNYNTDNTGKRTCDYFGIYDDAVRQLEGVVSTADYNRIVIIQPKNECMLLGWTSNHRRWRRTRLQRI
jgi:hypothetical protein